MKAIKDLSAADQLAISKISAPSTARGLLAVGKHAVDVTVRVTGVLTVGEDYQATPTASIPLKVALALFVRHCGVTRDNALAALEKAMRLALATDSSSEDAIKDMADLDASIAKVEATLAKLPQQTCKGKVTTKLNVEVIESPVEVAASHKSIEGAPANWKEVEA